jgi:hypothetical protein
MTSVNVYPFFARESLSLGVLEYIPTSGQKNVAITRPKSEDGLGTARTTAIQAFLVAEKGRLAQNQFKEEREFPFDISRFVCDRENRSPIT